MYNVEKFTQILLAKYLYTTILVMTIVISTDSNAKISENVAEDELQGNCLSCHLATQNTPVHAIWKTPHGKAMGKTNQACVTCHGPSLDHAKVPRDKPPTISFGPKWPTAREKQSKVCLGCHEKGNQLMWQNGAHYQEQLSCSSCHNSHARIDKALVRLEQAETCFKCHKSVQVSVHMQSNHPIIEGITTCADCHNPHGNISEHALNEPTVNDTCFSCHAEKRGPFLYEHAPVAEDCGTCHKPHGSVNASLLKTRGPFLCQQCHAAAFHPSVQFDGSGLGGRGNESQFLLGKNCLSCHSQVHGSNHPSGSRLTR